jgi:serine/threonine protein kinase
MEDLRTTVCGTASYAPPEVLKRSAYDPELMDVWSLGVTLFAMLAAQFPFSKDS